jgi:hypothetical protein
MSAAIDHSPSHRTTSKMSAVACRAMDSNGHAGDAPLHDKYGALFGYSTEFFTGLLLPKHNLFFFGHSICADSATRAVTCASAW